MNVGRIIDGVRAGIEFIGLVRDAWRKRGEPPMRIDDLDVGATTEDVVERERAKAREQWPGGGA